MNAEALASRKYEKPPLIETLCEFHFVPGLNKWDLTIPGLYYEKVKEAFPTRKQQMQLGIGVQPKEGAIQQMMQLATRVQFHREDGTALVQLGQDFLAVNHLPPYPHWENFQPLIVEQLRIYEAIAAPESCKTIALRYINRVDLDEAEIELTDYLRFCAVVPEEIPDRFGVLNLRVELPDAKEENLLMMVLASAEPQIEGGCSLLLDLTYTTRAGRSLAEACEWIEQAHTHVQSAFEACITDKLRERFKVIA